MKTRRFGDTDLETSLVALGTMRWDPARLGSTGARDLLLHLVDRGLTAIHSSREYAFHEFFCSVLRDVRRLRPRWAPVHVVKIGVPHFDESAFDPARLEAIVEQQRRALETDTIHVVQWLLRATPNTDERRLPLLARSRAALEDAWGRLQARGRVRFLASYPYSVPFLERALEVPVVRGLATYLNLEERELVPYLDRMHGEGRGLFAIRPLGAGRLVARGVSRLDAEAWSEVIEIVGGGSRTAAALRFPLLHPATASVVVGISSQSHADELLDAVDVDPDPGRFHAVAERLSARSPA